MRGFFMVPLFLAGLAGQSLSGQSLPPEPERRLARDIFRELVEIPSGYSTLWPGVPAVPIMVVGATDGLYLRVAGIPTYGVQGFFMDRDDVRFHGRDERMGVLSFYEGQQFLYALVKALSNAAD
jgi:acetylornithine deacetylase/succinyl-diaminopimelate desuccinylase-like protein